MLNVMFITISLLIWIFLTNFVIKNHDKFKHIKYFSSQKFKHFWLNFVIICVSLFISDILTTVFKNSNLMYLNIFWLIVIVIYDFRAILFIYNFTFGISKPKERDKL